MRLGHYWASGGVVEFNPQSGEVNTCLVAATEPIEFGAVWKQRGRWFVLWRDSSSFVFQRRQDRWKLTPDVTFRVGGKFRRTFQIVRKGNVEYQFSYWFRGALMAFIDPTYDRLDEEADDFFLYVTGMWEYWKNRSADEFAVLASSASSPDS